MTEQHGEPPADSPDSEDYEGQVPLQAEWKPTRRQLIGGGIAVAGMVVGGGIGYWIGRARYPGDNSIDAGFLRDMSTHHAQAVSMAMTIRAKSSSPDILTLAYDIATTQENQRGRMMGWLQQWGLSLAVHGQPMDWMRRTGHQHAGLEGKQMLLPDGRMPGMASTQQLQQLAAATGKPAEILFLQLMLAHHKAGVEMAEAARTSASSSEVVSLAAAMVTGQKSEITTMTQMLKDRGA